MSKPDNTSTFRSFAQAAAEVVNETLWPTRCAICDVPGDLLCDECTDALRFIDYWRACPRCGAPFGLMQCTECNPVMLEGGGRGDFPLERMASVLPFEQAGRRIASLYKDSNEQRLAAEVMAPLMARYVSPDWSFQCVTFIPATKAAVRKRGFDHAELLANALAKELGVECSCLLARPKSVDQRKLNRRERISNMANRFAVIDGAQIPRATLLIDDVCTTGATLYAAADALKEAGTEKVYGLTFLRVLK